MSLTGKELAFAAGVASGLSQTEAAKQAGYAPASASVTGSRLLRKAKVAAEINRLKAIAVATVEAETGITLQRLVTELAHAALLDPKDFYGPEGQLLPIAQMPEHARRAIATFEAEDEYIPGPGGDEQALIKLRTTKLRPNDKTRNIELIAKLLALMPKDTVKHEHAGGIILKWADED